MIGQTISHYRVLEKIGEGGMGEVYLAEDARLNRKVAIKLLPEYLENDKVAQERFLREARSAAAIDHPYTWDGRKVLVHLAPGTKESTGCCRDFLQDLQRRGLTDPVLVISVRQETSWVATPMEPVSSMDLC
jgi:serine/threonine protein kinase